MRRHPPWARRTRSRTWPRAGWRRHSSGTSLRTASRTPCRTSRRRGSRCRSSGRSRRSSSHLGLRYGLRIPERSGRPSTCRCRRHDPPTSARPSGRHRTTPAATVPDGLGTIGRWSDGASTPTVMAAVASVRRIGGARCRCVGSPSPPSLPSASCRSLRLRPPIRPVRPGEPAPPVPDVGPLRGCAATRG